MNCPNCQRSDLHLHTVTTEVSDANHAFAVYGDTADRVARKRARERMTPRLEAMVLDAKACITRRRSVAYGSLEITDEQVDELARAVVTVLALHTEG